MHHLALIQQTCVQGAVLADLLTSQEAQRTNPVVEVDKDNVSARRVDHFGAVVVVIAIVGVAATLDIEPDGQLGLGGCIGRLEDVDKQTIFVARVIWHLVDADANLVKLFPVSLALALGTEVHFVRTLEASCTPVSLTGSCGARNLRSPRGALAKRIPRNWSTPDSISLTPRYLAYPTSTTGPHDVAAAVAHAATAVSELRKRIGVSWSRNEFSRGTWTNSVNSPRAGDCFPLVTRR